jgi:hypothetical protein
MKSDEMSIWWLIIWLIFTHTQNYYMFLVCGILLCFLIRRQDIFFPPVDGYMFWLLYENRRTTKPLQNILTSSPLCILWWFNLVLALIKSQNMQLFNEKKIAFINRMSPFD